MSVEQFQRTGGARPPRTAFDLTHNFVFDCNMGELIPVFVEEVYPNEVFAMGNEVVVRFQPMLSPVLHEVNVDTYTFFIPYRLLWGSEHSKEMYPDEQGSWEEFITGNAKQDYINTINSKTASEQTTVAKKTLKETENAGTNNG